MDPVRVADRRPREPRGGHRGQPGAGRPPTRRCSRRWSRSTPIYLYFDSDEQTYLRYSGRAAAAGNRGWRDARFPSTSAWPTRPGFPHEGQLDFVDNRIDPAQRHDPHPRDLLQPRPPVHAGLFARVRLVGQRARSAPLLVRDAAVGTDQDRKFVLVLGRATACEYRPVELGRLSTMVSASCGRASRPATRSSSTGCMRVRPGMKVDRHAWSRWCRIVHDAGYAAWRATSAAVAER